MTPQALISPAPPPERMTLLEAITAKHQKRAEFRITAGEKAGAVWRFEASARGLASDRAAAAAVAPVNRIDRELAKRRVMAAVRERLDAIAVAQEWMVLRG